jgi:hypothetical protein
MRVRFKGSVLVDSFERGWASDLAAGSIRLGYEAATSA